MINHLDIFPSSIFFSDLKEYITDSIQLKINNIAKNLSEDLPYSHAFSSKDNLSDVLDLSKFEKLKEFVENNILQGIGQIYNIEKLKIDESFVVHIPKNGFIQTEKNFDSMFSVLINISKSSKIILVNPNTYLQSNLLSYSLPNKYNSRYATLPFEENVSITIPSNIHYGFSKLEEDLTYIQITVNNK